MKYILPFILKNTYTCIYTHCLSGIHTEVFRRIHNTLIRVSLGDRIMENFHLLYASVFEYYQKKNSINFLALCLPKASHCFVPYLAFLDYLKISHSINTYKKELTEITDFNT